MIKMFFTTLIFLSLATRDIQKSHSNYTRHDKAQHVCRSGAVIHVYINFNVQNKVRKLTLNSKNNFVLNGVNRIIATFLKRLLALSALSMLIL